MRALPILVLAGALFCACASTPGGSPETVADRILSALDAGNASAADNHFASIAKNEEARQKAYPILFGDARERYEDADFAGSATVLGFLAEHYPDATAVKEARVYALLLQRSQLAPPDDEHVAEMAAALADLRASGIASSPWVQLAEAQSAIDRGRPDEAPASLAVLRRAAEGDARIATYIDDLERALSDGR